ncbi:UNVERIFIED_CONTAM: hypothetical protein Slati_1184100 [Sesamum latifolium]|uniref:Uncharacterized protein n=1 Tax=Sesamum latifolium TaxID=2727402 RepID=A0AAW2XEK8_9LAMI
MQSRPVLWNEMTDDDIHSFGKYLGTYKLIKIREMQLRDSELAITVKIPCQFEHFDDFTLASSWERFISEIEAVCRQWLADGPKNLLLTSLRQQLRRLRCALDAMLSIFNPKVKDAVQINHLKDLYKVKSEFKYAMKSYCMEYYFAPSNDGKGADWDQTLHDLQLCFGVKEFLVIAPQSASGVVLDAPEASKLLSAVAIALSNCSWFGCYVS